LGPGQDGGFEEIPTVEPIVPFTGEDIASGVAFALVFGLRLQTPEEVAAFQRAFQAGVGGLLPPAAVLDALKVGDALAAYGIGKNRLPMGGVENLPPWLRILLGGAALAMAAYGGVRAVQEVRARADTPAPGSGAVAA
jgi:hypothetical protein